MNLLLSNIGLYVTLFLLCIAVIIVILIVLFSRLKKESHENLSLISERIESQKKLYTVLFNKVNESKAREQDTQKKIQDIRFELVQIDFSYHELLRELIGYSSA